MFDPMLEISSSTQPVAETVLLPSFATLVASVAVPAFKPTVVLGGYRLSMPAAVAPVVLAPSLPTAPASMTVTPSVKGSDAHDAGNGDHGAAVREQILLNCQALRRLRRKRLLSQQDLAYECERRNIRVSLVTIKRAECGHAVSYRTVRELARCFDVPIASLLRERLPAPAADATAQEAA